MEGLTGEEQDFICDARIDREPVEMMKVGVMCYQGLVRVRTLAAEFWTH